MLAFKFLGRYTVIAACVLGFNGLIYSNQEPLRGVGTNFAKAYIAFERKVGELAISGLREVSKSNSTIAIIAGAGCATGTCFLLYSQWQNSNNIFTNQEQDLTTLTLQPSDESLHGTYDYAFAPSLFFDYALDTDNINYTDYEGTH